MAKMTKKAKTLTLFAFFAIFAIFASQPAILASDEIFIHVFFASNAAKAIMGCEG